MWGGGGPEGGDGGWKSAPVPPHQLPEGGPERRAREMLPLKPNVGGVGQGGGQGGEMAGGGGHQRAVGATRGAPVPPTALSSL